MGSKVILVVIDGLRDDTAAAQMGFLEHMVEHRQAERSTVIAEMPSMSRPLYETLHTGVPPYIHGVVSNDVVRLSKMSNIFGIASQHGLVTAAAAYFWVSELYNAAPYDPIEHHEVDNPSANIQHGRFYMADIYPDAALFAQAERLVRHYAPDYLLIHPMGMDDTGHRFGGESAEYENHAIYVDQLLARLVPGWTEKGYSVLVTADHGMNKNHMHGGSGLDVRNVPLYAFLPGKKPDGEKHPPVSQLQIAPTVLKLLGLPIPDSMHMPPLV